MLDITMVASDSLLRIGKNCRSKNSQYRLQASILGESGMSFTTHAKLQGNQVEHNRQSQQPNLVASNNTVHVAVSIPESVTHAPAANASPPYMPTGFVCSRQNASR